MQKIENEKLAKQYFEQYNLQKVMDESVWLTGSISEYKAGEILCKQGELSSHLYFLLKGKVKIYSTSPEGKQLIVAFNSPLEIFCDIEFVQKTENLNTVEAVSMIQVMAIPFEALQALVEKDSRLVTYLLQIVTRKFRTKSQTLSFHLLNTVDIRLASYLLSITYDDQQNICRQYVSKTELQEISEFISTSYRHLNRVIKEFVLEGIVERTKEGITIKNLELLCEKSRGNIYETQ